MTTISIGNDIVDLNAKEPDLHPRFVSRVFSPMEREEIGQNIAKLWQYWSAKEASYKALKRINRNLIFSPRKFEVFSQEKVVTYLDNKLYLGQILNSEYVYSFCSTDQKQIADGKIYNWIKESSDSSPSKAVRSLALENISRLLKLDVCDLEIDSNVDGRSIPFIRIKQDASSSLLSFSHHGRFVACAYLT